MLAGALCVCLRVPPVSLQWSPTIPGVYSSSVYDGKVAISNVLDCTSAGVDSVNADFSVTHTAGTV